MTETEQKALALVNEVFHEHGETDRDWAGRDANPVHEALCRAIEQHEQFKREVSDAVEAYLNHMSPWPDDSLRRFILPKPVDPLVEVAEELRETYCATGADWAKAIRAALAKRGLEVRAIEK